MLEQKKEPGGRPGCQPGFVHHIAEGNTEAAADKSGIDFSEKGKINLLVHSGRHIMQQIVYLFTFF